MWQVYTMLFLVLSLEPQPEGRNTCRQPLRMPEICKYIGYCNQTAVVSIEYTMVIVNGIKVILI